MKLTSRHWLWLGLAVVALLSGLWSWRPMDKSAGRLAILPLEGFGFSSRDLPLNQTEIQTYRQAEAIKRLYQTKGQRFILTAVDGSRNRHAVHDPLYCFRGDGWQVLRQQLVTVPGGHAKLLTLTRSGRQTEVVFWFTDGRERHDSAGRVWWLSLCRRVTFGWAGQEPALVLLQPGNGETPAWSGVFAQCPFLFEL